jgi:phage tail tape-measure protein
MAKTRKQKLEKHAEIAGAIAGAAVGMLTSGPVGGAVGAVAGFYVGKEVEDLILESKSRKTRKR